MGVAQQSWCQLPASPQQFLLVFGCFFFIAQGKPQSHSFIPALPQV